MWVVLSTASFLLLGLAVARRCLREESSPAEQVFGASSFALVAWLATTWLFALAHLFHGPLLIVRTLAAGLIGLLLLRREGAALALPIRLRSEWLLFGVPVGAWVAFILWRGALLPPLSHDALAYHLPKAVLYERLGGYDRLSMLMANIRGLPANYEMLLADVIACTGSDRLTEWVSVLTYLMFVSASAALAARWLPRSRFATPVVSLLAAGVPVALLHSGTHKNDLMVAALMVGSCVWFGRWIAHGERAALASYLLLMGAAIGTKPQAAALGLCLLPSLLLLLWKRRDRMTANLAVILFSTLFATALLGGAVYLSNLFDQGAAFSVGTREQPRMMAYGDWRNLWDGPWVLITAPFSRNPNALWIPWEPAPWFWRRYEVYFSHMGTGFSIAALALLPVLLLIRRRDEVTAETVPVGMACAAAFVLTLPVAFAMHGLYAISLPRYILFIAPVVFAAAAGVVIERAEQRGLRALPAVVLVIAAASFCWNAVDTVVHDTFAPWSYVQWAREHPGTRVIPFDPNRAASVVDRAAGPDEKVAIDAASGTWIHPAFGAGLTRPVEFIQEAAGPLSLSDDVRWVMIDRAAAVVWGHPEFRDLSQVRQFLMKGQLSPADRRVFEQLSADRRFELVFYNPKLMQAVFRRVDPPRSAR